MQKQAMNVAVIGAGPAGLSAAIQLARKGHHVEVFEASEHVGGMARSFDLWGQRVDVGPHRFFSSDPRVNAFWLEFAGTDYRMVQRLTRIYYRRTFFDYPLKPFNALSGLGLFEAIRCVLSYAKARISPPSDTSTFEGWVTSRFGRRLFEIFFKSYSEKLWGISCRELDADFAAQRIKKLSLLEAIKAAFLGNQGGKHKTLVDEFAYPLDGAGQVYERMAASFQALGGVLHLKAPVASVKPAVQPGGSCVLTFPSGETRQYDHIVSTMPITHLVKGMDAPAEVVQCANSLRFRNTLIVFLRLAGDSPFPDQWIYVHAAELQTGRITNFRNWVPEINRGQADTILCLEYWCYDEDPIWKMEEADLVSLATREIEATGLVPAGTVRDGRSVRVPKCYPVYAKGYKENLQPVQDFLSAQSGVSAIGRYGAFKYNNQDHSILMGLLAAENIADGATHDLWGLNTDYEYQEGSRITATGLVREAQH